MLTYFFKKNLIKVVCNERSSCGLDELLHEALTFLGCNLVGMAFVKRLFAVMIFGVLLSIICLYVFIFYL